MRRLLAVTLLASLAGCGTASTTASTATTASDRGSAGGESLDPANGSIPNVCMGGNARVQVTSGAAEYDSELGEGFVGELTVEVIAVTDLDGDGTTEHVAMVRCMPGGSGTFDAVVAFHASEAGLAVAGSIEGGDRADGGLDGARVEGASVIVGRYSGDEGGVCCPTHVTDETWQLVDGAFARTSVGQTRPVEP